MGFGSYDESEQEKQDVDTAEDDDEAVSMNREGEDPENDVEFTFDGADTEELLDKLD